MATPLSAVSTILSLSSFNSLSAFFSSLVMLALGTLAFSISNWFLPYVPANLGLKVCGTVTIAVIKSLFGWLLCAMAKFGPLDKSDAWAGVKCVLDKLTTHLLVLFLLLDWLLSLLVLYVSCTWLPLLVDCVLLLFLSLTLLLTLFVNLLNIFTYLSLTMINLFRFVSHEDGCHYFYRKILPLILPNFRAYLSYPYIVYNFMDNLHNNYCT